jgi:hypothetical protein
MIINQFKFGSNGNSDRGKQLLRVSCPRHVAITLQE